MDKFTYPRSHRTRKYTRGPSQRRIHIRVIVSECNTILTVTDVTLNVTLTDTLSQQPHITFRSPMVYTITMTNCTAVTNKAKRIMNYTPKKASKHCRKVESKIYRLHYKDSICRAAKTPQNVRWVRMWVHSNLELTCTLCTPRGLYCQGSNTAKCGRRNILSGQPS